MFHWTMSPDLLEAIFCFLPSCMMVFASKMPTLRAFRALLKSFKKLGEVVSTSVWHHMQGLGPPDHVLDVRLMAHHPKSRGCKWLISNQSQHCAKWDNKENLIWEIYMFKNTGQLNNTVHMTRIQWHNFQSSQWGSIAWKKHGRNPAKGSCD